MKPILTVLTSQTPEGILCRGISEDETLFDNVLMQSTTELVERVGRHYSKTHRVVFNFPEVT